MAKKLFSVIFVPHSKTSFKTLTFSKRAAKFFMVGTGVAFLSLGVVLVDYFSMTLIRSKYKNLRHENIQQKEKIAGYENSIARLKSTIANFENYARKLNVMLGLKSADIIKGEPGIGGGDPIPANEPEAAQDPQTISLSGLQNLTQKAESVEKNIGSLVGIVESRLAMLATTPTIWPTRGWIVSSFGYRIDPFTGKKAFHRGLDIATNSGNPVAATADGIVISAGVDKSFGNNVIVSHGNGIVTQYCHLEKYIVRAGQKVKRGDTLGFVGKTGKALGPHLHYEVRVNDKSVNPYNYILEE